MGGSGTVEWPDRQGEPEQFDQIWFAGNHADIGGSYPENESRLSDITLHWMVEFITVKMPEAGRVIVDKNLLRLYPSADGMMHDECMVGMSGTALHGRKRSATYRTAEVLKSLGMKPENSDQPAEMANKLKSSKNFDTDYLAAQLDGHQQLLKIQDDYIGVAKDPAHLGLAKLARTQIKEHIDLIQTIQKNLKT